MANTIKRGDAVYFVFDDMTLRGRVVSRPFSLSFEGDVVREVMDDKGRILLVPAANLKVEKES
jgi:hypothetical protein